jgi:transposase
MRFSTILDRWDTGEMTQETAAELLGMSVRSFQRWRERYQADGEAGWSTGAAARRPAAGAAGGTRAFEQSASPTTFWATA